MECVSVIRSSRTIAAHNIHGSSAVQYTVDKVVDELNEVDEVDEEELMPQTVQVSVISGNVVQNSRTAGEMDALLLGRTKVSRN